MESNIRSSFIPQSPVAAPTGPKRRTGGNFDLFMLLSLVLFIASAVLAAGVFLYVQYMTANSQSKLDQLERAKAAFEPALIAELTRLDDRMRAADEVLGIHIAPSAIFHLLEQLTLQTVAFSSFDFSAQSATDMTLTMNGLAQSVNSIALEADLLSKSGVVTNPIFSNINRTAQGVRFDFTADVNADSLRYRSVMRGSSGQQAPAQGSLEQLLASPPSEAPFGETAEEPETTVPVQP